MFFFNSVPRGETFNAASVAEVREMKRGNEFGEEEASALERNDNSENFRSRISDVSGE